MHPSSKFLYRIMPTPFLPLSRWFHTKTSNVRHQIEDRIQSLFDEIEADYDFRTFDLDDFRQWIAHREQRAIEFVAFPFPPLIFGGCVRGFETDFAFYDCNSLPLLQVHIQLHELSHLLCGHGMIDDSFDSDEQLLEQLFMQLVDMSEHPEQQAETITSVLHRSRQNTAEELEAELLSEFILSKVAAHRRYEALKKPITFSQRTAEIYAATGLA